MWLQARPSRRYILHGRDKHLTRAQDSCCNERMCAHLAYMDHVSSFMVMHLHFASTEGVETVVAVVSYKRFQHVRHWKHLHYYRHRCCRRYVYPEESDE